MPPQTVTSDSWLKVNESRTNEFATKDSSFLKSQGVHYTPPDLSEFLAGEILKQLKISSNTIKILDPACGDGGLLMAIAEKIPPLLRKNLILVGYDMDENAIAQSRKLLSHIEAKEISLHRKDFLITALSEKDKFDAVISNPPYVRTQVLGAEKAKELAANFGLSGRVDLYQAFTVAMTTALKKGGVIGLLTSNRFLFTQSGADMREFLRTKYDLKEVYDLGDTKLFSAAVLPAIIIGVKDGKSVDRSCNYCRAYELRDSNGDSPQSSKKGGVLESLARKIGGVVSTPNGRFSIEIGQLALPEHLSDSWSLVSEKSEKWLDTVQANQHYTFSDVASIKVGIKTTADNVFIRNDWSEMVDAPESQLLLPLFTHHNAGKWNPVSSKKGDARVLYPYASEKGKRVTLDITNYPKCKKYLESHSEQLKGRKYVMESGRQWFEIWVPHKLDDWKKPKIIFPDIAEHPQCFLDMNGSIVNGDCYWVTLEQDVEKDWLYLMLAIMNSSFITYYYDVVVHNKLYAGRRRFMTQYVKKFPLPDLNSASSKKIVKMAKELVEGQQKEPDAESKIDLLVWQSFGLEKIAR